ncbi:MAG: phosphotransferase [Gammaproteobacteria bacterium]|nr:phosphotransferase [Gammaproteobacteria bacterium]
MAWIDGLDALAGCEPQPASEDASFRRYFRLQKDGQSFIVMDAPPAQEDSLPFVRVAGYLEAMGLNAPRVIEADLDAGFLLLSDLGQRLYLSELKQHPQRAPSLYADAMNALWVMQRRGAAYQAALPPYDECLLRFELSLFHDWLCGTHLGLAFSDADERAWQDLCQTLVDNALHQPQVFVHRDYHSRNLMVAQENNPGILDFQDAVEGPLTYDLVSLLKDCYVRWPAKDVRNWALLFYEGRDDGMRAQIDETLFFRFFELMGVQRHLKAAGIFARLNHRDGKDGYMADIPRTLSYIVELGDDYEELKFVVALIEERVLPQLGGGQ